MATEILAVRLSEDVLKQIDQLADQAGFNRSEWLRAIIMKELATAEQDWGQFLEEQLVVLLNAIPKMTRKSQSRIYRILPQTHLQLLELPLDEKKDLVMELIESIIKTKSKSS